MCYNNIVKALPFDISDACKRYPFGKNLPCIGSTLEEKPSSTREINDEALTINCILVTMLVLMRVRFHFCFFTRFLLMNKVILHS